MKLETGQVFDSLKDLCQCLDVKYHPRTSKLNRKRVNRFCEFHYEGKKVIIDSVIETPMPMRCNNRDFCYHVGDRVSCKTGDLIIESCFRDPNKRNIKSYTYRCTICGHVQNISEAHLLDGVSCASCTGRKTSKTANTNMWCTNPEMASLLLSPEDGYNYRFTSTKELDWKCPYCGEVIPNRKPSVVFICGLGCRNCGKGISYPNKLFENVLLQLKIKHFSEKRFSWCKFKKYDSDSITYGVYDFVIDNMKLIVELDGGLGHGNKSFKNLKDPRETEYNDRQKDYLAVRNGYSVIRVDVNYKQPRKRFDYCVSNIVKSLSEYIDFSDVDWSQAHESAEASVYLSACKKYNEGYTIKQIAECFNLSTDTIRNYLTQGTENGVIDYYSNIKLTKVYLENKGYVINNQKDKVRAGYELITGYIRNHPEKTRDQVAQALGISPTSIWHYLYTYPEKYGFNEKAVVFPRGASERSKLERKTCETLPDDAVKCCNYENLYIDKKANVYRQNNKGEYSLLPHKLIKIGKKIEIRVNYTIPGGRNIPISVARLLAESFIISEDCKYQVKFKDGDSTNLALSNIYVKPTKPTQ